jgi:hypothetical protein
VISILVTLFSSLGTLLLDYLFIDILSAPTAADSNDHSTPVSSFPSLSPPQGRVRVTRAKSTLKLDNEVRVVPHGLVAAHSEAVISFGQLMSGSEDHVKKEITNRNLIRMKRLTQMKSSNSELINSLPAPVIKEMPSAAAQLPPQQSGELLLQSLLQDLQEERKKLKRESEKESFDSLWGCVICPFLLLSFSLPSLCTLSLSRIHPSSSNKLISEEQKEIMKRELVHVLEETAKKVDKLRSANDIQIGLFPSLPSPSLSSRHLRPGMEIIHLFILDLLGRYEDRLLSFCHVTISSRDTPAAKIFRMKSEEDFRHSMVVTNLFKALTWVCVLLLNLGMIYFTMLRGLQRGYDWQVHDLLLCLRHFSLLGPRESISSLVFCSLLSKSFSTRPRSVC